MNHREFVYTGEPIPVINEEKFPSFLLNVQKAIIYLLAERELLTPIQRERCLEELERRHNCI